MDIVWGKIENRISYFVENKALFGGFPTQENIYELEEMGVKYFLDLTETGERNTYNYTTNYNYENYPIKDRCCPPDKISFGKLIIKYSKIINTLSEGEKIYIHCRGGHGRSGIVVASLLTWIYKINPQEAITKTHICHSERKIMTEKWRYLGCPNSRKQKNFVLTFFKPIYINRRKEFSLADIFDNVNLKLNKEKIFLILLEKIENNPVLIHSLLNTGLGRIILNSALQHNRTIFSQILGKIRTHLFECLEEVQ